MYFNKNIWKENFNYIYNLKEWVSKKYGNIKIEKSTKSQSFYIKITDKNFDIILISVRDHKNNYEKGDYHFDSREFENWTQLKKEIIKLIKKYGIKKVEEKEICGHERYDDNYKKKKKKNYCWICGEWFEKDA